MNRPIYLLSLFFAVFIVSCHHAGKQSSSRAAAVKPAAKDTIWENDSTYYVEMLDEKMDSTAKIKFFTNLGISKLNAHPNEPRFDTAVLLNGAAGSIYFFQGHVFSGKHNNALVYIDDKDETPILFFTNNGSWQLRQVFHGYGKLADTAIHFADFNFDGRKDLIINWYYSAGRCNCSANYCWDVYLYNEASDSLMHFHNTRGYLDFGISEKEKAIYLGEHCEGFYGKFKWVDDSLTRVEAYLSDEDKIQDGHPWTMQHVLYKNQQSVVVGKKNKGELPASWQHFFGWDRYD